MSEQDEKDKMSDRARNMKKLVEGFKAKKAGDSNALLNALRGIESDDAGTGKIATRLKVEPPSAGDISHKTQTTLSDDEVHNLGVNFILNWMKGEDYEIFVVQSDSNVDPQMIAGKYGRIFHVVVRAARFPETGSIENEELQHRQISYANVNDADCLFAAVGIGNADGENDRERSVLLKGGNFMVAFEGLEVLQLPEGVSPLDDVPRYRK